MTATRGILAYGAHVPYRRLDRAAIRNVMGSGGGRGHRAVASFDQDTTTMGVEAARQALATTDLAPGALWFSTVAPAYLDKTNATTAHAALRLDAGVPALDLGGAARSAVGALRTALEAPGRTLVVAADLRCGLPTSTDEAAGGDAASAVLTGSDDDGPLLAEYLGGASATAEFVDRWRTPGDATSRTWEERFGEQAYAPLVDRAWADALAATGLDADGIDLAVVTGLHARATKRSGGRLGVTVADDRSDTIGNSGAAHPALLLADVLDTAETGTVVALVVLPVVVVTTLQVAGVDPLSQRASWRTAVRWGVWVAVGAAFAPVVLPLALLGALVVAALDPRLVRRLLLGVAVAVLLLGPWVVGRLLHPGLWWWESGSPLAGGDPGWRTALGLVVGRAGVPEQAPVWLGVGLVVLAVLALASRAARAVVVVCWTLALLALGVAVLGVVLPGGVPGTSVDVRAWVGVPAGAVALALGTAALVGVPPLVEGRGRAWVGSALVLALLLPVGTAAWWVVRGVDDPLERGRPDTVPAFLTDRGADTVVVTGTTGRGLEVEVVRGEGPLVGAEGLRPPEASRRALVDAVERLVSAPGTQAVSSLSDLGVDAVYAPDVDTEVARALDAAPGLEPSGSESPTSRVWTLAEPTQPARPEAPAWRPFLAAGQVLLWLVAVVLTAPVRRRPSTPDDTPSGDVTSGGGRRVRTDEVRS